MAGDLQPLYLLLTDCYIYLLRKGQWQKKNDKVSTVAVLLHLHEIKKNRKHLEIVIL